MNAWRKIEYSIWRGAIDRSISHGPIRVNKCDTPEANQSTERTPAPLSLMAVMCVRYRANDANTHTRTHERNSRNKLIITGDKFQLKNGRVRCDALRSVPRSAAEVKSKCNVCAASPFTCFEKPVSIFCTSSISAHFAVDAICLFLPLRISVR